MAAKRSTPSPLGTPPLGTPSASSAPSQSVASNPTAPQIPYSLPDNAPGTAEPQLGPFPERRIQSQHPRSSTASQTTTDPRRSAEPSGSTEPQLGHQHQHAGKAPRGWYTRGYLPHCDHPALLQFITYHLADSLPREALRRMDARLKGLSAASRAAERRKTIEAWADRGQGCCILAEDEAAACVLETWRHFAGQRYDLIAWVVMPNHVHVLIRVYEGVSLARIVQSWKSYTGRRLQALLAARGGTQSVQGVWMREYWDRFIRDERHLRAAIDYIHQNPVKAGLVRQATDWPWSSARAFAEADRGRDG